MNFVKASSTYNEETAGVLGKRDKLDASEASISRAAEEAQHAHDRRARRGGLGFDEPAEPAPKEAAAVGELDVRGHYDGRQNQSIDKRSMSRVVQAFNFNNWVKSALFNRYIKEHMICLDLAGGKGGDLKKFQMAGVDGIVLADIAHQSVKDAVTRYREMFMSKDVLHGRSRMFGAKFIAADCTRVALGPCLPPQIKFDAVSCQFAIHYSFQDEGRARMMMENVTRRLKPGGHFVGTTTDANVLVRKLREAPGLEFGNDVYRVRFEVPGRAGAGGWDKSFPRDSPFGNRYLFYLEDAVGHKDAEGRLEMVPEYLVPFPALVRLAGEYGLELVESENLHRFWQAHHAEPDLLPLVKRIKVLDEKGTMPAFVWEVAYLYRTFAFRMRGAREEEDAAEQELLRRVVFPAQPDAVRIEDIIVIDS
eukprot:tig00021608_g22839.t1